MSGAAHRGDDDIAFYAADIGITFHLSATSGSPVQTTDAEGPLPEGRYIIQALNISTDSALVWIGFGAFEQSTTLALTAGVGTRRIPLSAGGLIAVETNILKGYSDRVAAITSAGAADVYLTLVSRTA